MTSSKRTKFLDIKDIGDSIEAVLELARDQGVKLALAGGTALQLYGSQRFTKDVDFLASALLDGLVFVQPIGFGGAQYKTSAGIPVDLIVRDDDYADLYETALSNAIRIQDIPIPVVSAEYMVALKLAASRDKDILDLQFLLIDDEELNYETARKIVHRYLGRYAADELDRYLADFKWTAEREKNPPKRR